VEACVTDDDDMIERYRSELVAEAELANGDLDEIEDHLRSLVGELRERGMPRALAIAEACRRLGEPRAIAREHARVRTPFGARLTRTRAWSAAVLLLAPIIYFNVVRPVHELTSAAGIDMMLAWIGVVAMVTRRTWARPIWLGSLLAGVPWTAVWVVTEPTAVGIATLVTMLGAAAFLVPWRRGELATGGFALVLLGPAYAPALSSLNLMLSAPHGVVLPNPLGTIAFVGVLLAAGGIILRARWAAIGAAGAAVGLVAFAQQIGGMTMRMPHPSLMSTMMVGSVYAGAACAAAAAVLAWRTGRWQLGTLRGVLD
jgi:hypothetical protein